MGREKSQQSPLRRDYSKKGILSNDPKTARGELQQTATKKPSMGALSEKRVFFEIFDNQTMSKIRRNSRKGE